jgi:hypothetical protein
MTRTNLIVQMYNEFDKSNIKSIKREIGKKQREFGLDYDSIKGVKSAYLSYGFISPEKLWEKAENFKYVIGDIKKKDQLELIRFYALNQFSNDYNLIKEAEHERKIRAGEKEALKEEYFKKRSAEKVLIRRKCDNIMKKINGEIPGIFRKPFENLLKYSSAGQDCVSIDLPKWSDHQILTNNYLEPTLIIDYFHALLKEAKIKEKGIGLHGWSNLTFHSKNCVCRD